VRSQEKKQKEEQQVWRKQQQQRDEKMRRRGTKPRSPAEAPNVWGDDESPAIARIIRSASYAASEAALAAEMKIQRLLSGEMNKIATATPKEDAAKAKKKAKAADKLFGPGKPSTRGEKTGGRRAGIPRNQQEKAQMVADDAAAAAASTVVRMLADLPCTTEHADGTAKQAAAAAAAGSQYRLLAKQVFNAVVEHGTRLFPDSRPGKAHSEQTNSSSGSNHVATPTGSLKSREGERAGDLQRQLAGKQQKEVVDKGTSALEKATTAALQLAAKHAASRALETSVEAYAMRTAALALEERASFDAPGDSDCEEDELSKTAQQLDEIEAKAHRLEEEEREWYESVAMVAEACSGAAADVVYWLGSMTAAESGHAGDEEGAKKKKKETTAGGQKDESAAEKARAEAKQLVLMASAATCAGEAAYDAVKYRPLQKHRPHFLSRSDIEGEAWAAKKGAEKAETEWGVTPVCVAVLRGKRRVVKTLFALGIDLSARATRKLQFSPTELALRLVNKAKVQMAQEQLAPSPAGRGNTSASDALDMRLGMLELFAGLGVKQAVQALDEQALEKAKDDREQWKNEQLELAQQMRRGGAAAKEAKKKQAEKQSRSSANSKQAPLSSNKVFATGKWFCVTKLDGVAVRETAELKSLIVRRMNVGEAFMATERRLIVGQVVRLRVRGGWTSATSSYDGSPLVKRCKKPTQEHGGRGRYRSTPLLSPPR
jgi:hypothetical protein